MKMILLGMAASAAVVASPVAAQSASGTYQNPNGGYRNSDDIYGNRNNGGANGDLAARIEQLRARIQAGVQSGAIPRQQAAPLRQQLRDLTQAERQYSLDGLSGQERADLQQRLRTLRQQVRTADGGAQGRYDQYDREAYGQYGQGADDRSYDGDDQYDDSNDDVAPQPVQRTGVAGILDRVLGNGGGLRVGQQVPGNLGGVPSQYRNQYRDGGGFYHRSDGRSIYRIDSRTQTVARVYPIN